MTTPNKQVLLASRPQGRVTEDNFRIVEAPIGRPAAGEVLVRNEWLSLDPYMRGRMSEAKSYVPPVQLGEVMVGQTVGEVIESQDARFKPGDKVLTPLGWQLYGVARGKELTPIDVNRAPASYYLGALGSVVGQLAKIAGCHAVGIAGGKAKCEYVVRELGFDACIDYRAGKLLPELRQACPKGVDVDFENVGGEILDALLSIMNPFSRIVLCGLIADYDVSEPHGYKKLRSVLVNRIRMQGMIVFDWKHRYGEALQALAGHLAAGKLKYRESVVHGLDNAPRGLIALLKGEHFGKQLVKLD